MHSPHSVGNGVDEEEAIGSEEDGDSFERGPGDP